MRSFVITLATIVLYALTVTDALPLTKQTFLKQIRTKLFIGTPIVCDAVEVVPVPAIPIYQAKLAAFNSFCAISDDAYHENPPTGVVDENAAIPLKDARVVGIINLKVTCEAGSTVPIDGKVSTVYTVGGAEIGLLHVLGPANPLKVADHLKTNGTFSLVVSGRPNAGLEWAFLIHRDRSNPDIWHRLEGTVTCNTDSNGQVTEPDLHVHFTTTTRFPSHRAYWYKPSGTFLGSVGIDVIQQAYSNLWFLPRIGEP